MSRARERTLNAAPIPRKEPPADTDASNAIELASLAASATLLYDSERVHEKSGIEETPLGVLYLASRVNQLNEYESAITGWRRPWSSM